MQYVFIFQAMLEHYLYGDTELEVTSLESHLNKLYAPLPGAGCGGMEAEFKVAQTAFGNFGNDIGLGPCCSVVHVLFIIFFSLLETYLH